MLIELRTPQGDLLAEHREWDALPSTGDWIAIADDVFEILPGPHRQATRIDELLGDVEVLVVRARQVEQSLRVRVRAARGNRTRARVQRGMRMTMTSDERFQSVMVEASCHFLVLDDDQANRLRTFLRDEISADPTFGLDPDRVQRVAERAARAITTGPATNGEAASELAGF